MGSLSLNSMSTVMPREPANFALVKLGHQPANGWFMNKNKNKNKNMNMNKNKVVCCHEAEKEFHVNGLNERSTVEATEDYMGVSPNGTSKPVEHHEGLGIARYLNGKVLFITGGTGFLGKVLIEKILRTTPDVGKIFVLIKAKDQESAMDRLMSEIVQTELFRCLQEIHGRNYQAFILRKIVPVAGNLLETHLGIQSDLADVISEQVHIIVNSAANTTFDERYDLALNINTMGPCRLMSFAKRCKKLSIFVQVSTAYVNGQRQGRVLEKAFSEGESIAREKTDSDSSIDPIPLLDIEVEIKLAFEFASSYPNGSLAHDLKELGLKRARFYGWQDTYVFTKAMGEMVINRMRGDIPVVTIRPSIIESTCREPFPGWMEGTRMMDPIVLYYGKGQLTGFLADPNGVLDLVPADMVVNATLAAMTKHGSRKNPGTNIYHVASSVINPLVIKDLVKQSFEHFSSSPYMDSNGMPIHVPEFKLFENTDDFTSHVWNDAIERSERLCSSTGNEKLKHKLKNICMKSFEQAKYMAGLYEPYTFYGGRFDNTNTQKLMEEMSEEEKMNFGFDIGSIEWKDYISSIHIPGLRRYVMKGRGNI